MLAKITAIKSLPHNHRLGATLARTIAWRKRTEATKALLRELPFAGINDIDLEKKSQGDGPATALRSLVDDTIKLLRRVTFRRVTRTVCKSSASADDDVVSPLVQTTIKKTIFRELIEFTGADRQANKALLKAMPFYGIDGAEPFLRLDPAPTFKIYGKLFKQMRLHRMNSERMLQALPFFYATDEDFVMRRDDTVAKRHVSNKKALKQLPFYVINAHHDGPVSLIADVTRDSALLQHQNEIKDVVQTDRPNAGDSTVSTNGKKFTITYSVTTGFKRLLSSVKSAFSHLRSKKPKIALNDIIGASEQYDKMSFTNDGLMDGRKLLGIAAVNHSFSSAAPSLAAQSIGATAAE